MRPSPAVLFARRLGGLCLIAVTLLPAPVPLAAQGPPAGREAGTDTGPRLVGSLDVDAARLPAKLSIADRAEAVGATFDVALPAGESWLLRFEVDGHFPALQTVTSADVRDGRIELPAVRPVPRAAGRRLLVFGGDTMLGRRYERPRASEPVLVGAATASADARALLRHVAPYLRAADLASVNLESCIFDAPLASETPKSVTFFSRPALLGALADAGIDHVALGNNHVFDFGQAGIAATLGNLRASPLAWSGGGTTEAEARRPAIAALDGGPARLFSYVTWPGTFAPSQVAVGDKGGAALATLAVLGDDLRTADAEHVDVVQLHGGFEYADRPSLRLATLARHAIDRGADLVIGHHPHVVQGFDLHRGRLIAWSLGNFLFDQYIYGTQFGMLLQVWVDGERWVRAEVVPIYLQGYTPTAASGLQRDAVLRRLTGLTDHGELRVSRSGMHLVLEPRGDREPAPVAQLALRIGGEPLSLRDRLAAERRVRGVVDGEGLRFGTDLWARGDFEHDHLHGAPERGWLGGDGIERVRDDDGDHLLRVRCGAGERRIGMKTFQRTFTPSADVTLRLRARSRGGPVRMTFRSQRRRTTEGLGEALEGGWSEVVGAATVADEAWRTLAFDFAWVRVPTRGVRVFAEVAGPEGAVLEVDDWELIEWRTPPLQPGVPLDVPASFTHVQRCAGGDAVPAVLEVDAVASEGR